MEASNFDYILRKVVVVPVLALLAGAALLAWQIAAANETVSLIQKSDERIAQTLHIEQLIVDQETGLRGFEVTHDSRLLQPFLAAQKALPQAFDNRRALATNDTRRSAVDSVRSSHATWEQGFAIPIIATIKAGGATNDVQLNYQGKLLMDDVRHSIAALNYSTGVNRDVFAERWHTQVRNTTLACILLAVLIGLVVGLYLRSLVKQVSRAFRQSHDILRTRAEQTFRSEERLRTTLRSIADGVITCDPDGRVQSLNDTASELTGWSEEQAQNQSIDAVFPIIDAKTRLPIESPVARVMQGNTAARLQINTILQRRNGPEIFIEDSGSPMRDKHGKLIGIVVVFRDVTYARKSQEALLANEKLAVAGRLAASIAHEIHNPLDSVANLLFLMDGMATPDERDHFLELAKLEIARVTQISRAMLSLHRESRIPVLVDLREMLGSILLLMESRFQTQSVAVTQEVPGGLSVQGFPAELRQVFTNLLTNAAEAAGSGGHVRVHASAEPAASSDDGLARPAGVVITVEDDGPGVPEEIASSLFQPFFTTKGERGTGLGLWISRGIVTKHGGTIQLASSIHEADHGTRVSVFLQNNPAISLPAS